MPRPRLVQQRAASAGTVRLLQQGLTRLPRQGQGISPRLLRWPSPSCRGRGGGACWQQGRPPRPPRPPQHGGRAVWRPPRTSPLLRSPRPRQQAAGGAAPAACPPGPLLRAGGSLLGPPPPSRAPQRTDALKSTPGVPRRGQRSSEMAAPAPPPPCSRQRAPVPPRRTAAFCSRAAARPRPPHERRQRRPWQEERPSQHVPGCGRPPLLTRTGG